MGQMMNGNISQLIYNYPKERYEFACKKNYAQFYKRRVS